MVDAIELTRRGRRRRRPRRLRADRTDRRLVVLACGLRISRQLTDDPRDTPDGWSAESRLRRRRAGDPGRWAEGDLRRAGRGQSAFQADARPWRDRPHEGLPGVADQVDRRAPRPSGGDELDPPSTAYAEPFDTYCDMSHLLGAEGYEGVDGPKAVALLLRGAAGRARRVDARGRRFGPPPGSTSSSGLRRSGPVRSATARSTGTSCSIPSAGSGRDRLRRSTSARTSRPPTAT